MQSCLCSLLFYFYGQGGMSNMASKYELITELADVTAKRIASDREEWTKYLKTAARLYRYPFREQMLIYAQRPDATAVASMEICN